VIFIRNQDLQATLWTSRSSSKARNDYCDSKTCRFVCRKLHTASSRLTAIVNLLPYCGQIIALGNGTVLEQGALTDLHARRGYVHSFCLEHANDGNATRIDANSTEGNAYKLGKKQDTSGAGLPAGKGWQQRDLSVYGYYPRTGGKYTCIFLILEVLWAFLILDPKCLCCVFVGVGKFGVRQFSVQQFSVQQFSVQQFGVRQFGVQQPGVQQFGVRQFGVLHFSVQQFGVLQLSVRQFGVPTGFSDFLP
jgi:hypothetical protein